MENSEEFNRMLEESRKERNIQYLFRKKAAEYTLYSPYTIDIVDQFQGHDEDGYGTWAVKDELSSAIAEARKITEEAIGPNKNIHGWHGMGDAGLVYDKKHNLIWDGVTEYAEANSLKELLDKDTGGIKRILEAVDFAGKAHKGHFRKGTTIPYITHPINAAYSLLWRKCPTDAVIAAILHDTLEDTKVSYDELVRNFGEEVASIVKDVTEPDRNDTRENRKKHTIDTIRSLKLNSLLVALADKYDNICAIEFDYRTEGKLLWKRFNRSEEQQRWYYTSLAQSLSLRRDNETIIGMVESFCSCVKVVFG